MTRIVVLGYGHIGQAVEILVRRLSLMNDVITYDANPDSGATRIIDLAQVSELALVTALSIDKPEFVINSLPFFLNEKVAKAALGAGAHYIDFTEDDDMADRVQAIYKGSSLNCAVKCGLAPGFINYLGKEIVGKIDKPQSLMISVGALPRNVNWKDGQEHLSYNLTWSVDGLVNEYIRPCRIKSNGGEKNIPAVTGIETIIADGVQYEAAFTSGGIGSLVSELSHVPNIAYKSLRYPGHYKYVRDALARNSSDFDKLKKEFLEVFPYTSNDVIVVYVEAKGKSKGKLVRETFANHYIGVDNLTAIQSTTAGGGVAMFELMQRGRLKGIINHSDVALSDFMNTTTFKYSYIKRT